MEFDYEKDDFADPSGAASVPDAVQAQSVAQELKEAFAIRQLEESQHRSNNDRERARADLEQILWKRSDGQLVPVRWTVFAKAYYEPLCSVAGINSDLGTDKVEGKSISLYIWLWLATHSRDACLDKIPLLGISLKDHFGLWLETIFLWAEEEFAMGPDHFSRESEGFEIKARVMTLTYLSRADVMDSPDPSEKEDAPGN